jgi:hypothetical protein
LDVPEDADISCHLQIEGMGTLKCRAAQESDKSKSDRVNPLICHSCDAGKIYREVGCDKVTPYLMILPTPTHDSRGYEAINRIIQLNCSLRKRQTTLEECRSCTLVPAETTKELVNSTLGIFQAQGFVSAYNDLLEARNELRDGDCDDAIGKAINCLESTMRCVHEELGVQLPSKRTVTGLWQSTKDLLKFNGITTEAQDDVTALIGSMSGIVSHLGGMRNVLGDSHGKGLIPAEVSEALAELAINAAATVATVIIRRHRQLAVQP